MTFTLQVFIRGLFLGDDRLLRHLAGLLAAVLADVRPVRAIPPAAPHRRRLRQRAGRAALSLGHLKVDDDHLHFGKFRSENVAD